MGVISRMLLAGAVAAVVSLTAAGCQPEPAPTSSPTPAETTPAATPAPTPTPIETEVPQGESLPASCEDVYSPGMLAAMEADLPPLNDPGVTMLSTQVVDLLDLLGSGLPTLRCSWGSPSEVGVATNVTLLAAGQADTILGALGAAGFGCEASAGGTICSIEHKGVSLDDQQYSNGEVHYVDEAHWVSTAWLNFFPEGYTDDIVDHLWG